jgi:hypothetical protein
MQQAAGRARPSVLLVGAGPARVSLSPALAQRAKVRTSAPSTRTRTRTHACTHGRRSSCATTAWRPTRRWSSRSRTSSCTRTTFAARPTSTSQTAATTRAPRSVACAVAHALRVRWARAALPSAARQAPRTARRARAPSVRRPAHARLRVCDCCRRADSRGCAVGRLPLGAGVWARQFVRVAGGAVQALRAAARAAERGA